MVAVSKHQCHLPTPPAFRDQWSRTVRICRGAAPSNQEGTDIHAPWLALTYVLTLPCNLLNEPYHVHKCDLSQVQSTVLAHTSQGKAYPIPWASGTAAESGSSKI